MKLASNFLTIFCFYFVTLQFGHRKLKIWSDKNYVTSYGQAVRTCNNFLLLVSIVSIFYSCLKSIQVPGKSAQDCFDKIHSDHITPPQAQPQSRANKINSSPLKHFSLSASKLLKPTGLKIKRSSCNKRKSHLAQKMVRHLLQKNYHMDPGYEADLFSVLEPNINPSTQVTEQNGLVSSPKHLQEKWEFLQKCHERPSEHKKPLTKSSDSCGKPLVSPPVLKPVKNRALHEKYLDQLLGREAKRKAASARAERLIPGKENRGVIDSQKIDVIRAAKSALVTDARNVITQLQHLNENSMSNSSDFCCDGIDNDDDEGEIEL